ncbi:MAG TPA: helix-turn-helix domain-containing protein [Pyrinomonadaceae bacterium]|nr:helix-turn-helix domain-containing protein [Pyrinomonadaceae bacterium]
MAASFGEELRLAREARGVTLRQISDQTRISIRYLEAIEANDYKRLPGGIFNRSFIKAYAKQIGFDEKAALEGYLKTAREQGESPDEVTSTPYKSHVYTDGGTRSPLVTVLLSALILAILVLGAWAVLHWYQRREAAREPSPPQAPVANNTQAANGPAPQPTQSLPAPEFRNVNITAKENVYVSWVVDGKKSSGRFVGPDKPAVSLNPTDRFTIRYDRKDAPQIEVTIDGRPLKGLPGDQTQFEITKDNYAEFVR